MSADKRNAELIDLWRHQFGEESVRIVRNHAKIARAWNDDWHFLLRGSMNLNWNPRFEQFDITEGGADFELVEGIEDELPVLPRKYKWEQVRDASKLGRVYSDEVVGKFGDLSSTTNFTVGRLDEVAS
ncbi:MAG: hypothetical protein IPK78_18260 [Rhodospirillales bacterium]|nr:hypothetical protein [Rhodospirillales bacterium]